MVIEECEISLLEYNKERSSLIIIGQFDIEQTLNVYCSDKWVLKTVELFFSNETIK